MLENKNKSIPKKPQSTLRQLQSLIGTINYVCAAVHPERTFVRCIINLTRGMLSPFHQRNLDKEDWADLKAWAILLDHLNGRGLTPIY